MRWVIVTLLIAIATPTFANVPAGSIGQIKGSGVIERDNDVIDGGNGVEVQMQDTAVTANGTMRIDFKDETRVDLTEHARLTIDEFVYDPASNTGNLSIRATLGGVRYASGQIAKRNRQNVRIQTPSATIGVRGTDFVMVVDELGGSMITLLPSCDTFGMCYVGEIDVTTDAGTVVMNQAFQSTLTTTRWQPPSPPLLIDIEERLLNQLIILRKRTPYMEASEEFNAGARRADFLGLDFLQFDALDQDLLNTDELWVSALDDTQYMLAELLYDMLDQLNAAIMAIFQDELFRLNQIMLRQETNTYGFDPETGIRLEKDDNSWVWTREDNQNNNNIRLRLHQNNNYVLNIQQGDFVIYEYILGTDRSNTIDIIQSN